MMERLLRLQPYFGVMAAEGSLSAEKNLTPAEWTAVEETTALLKPFMVAQKFLEGEKYVTISFVLVIISRIRQNLTAVTTDLNCSLQQKNLANGLLADFNKRWRSGLPGTIWRESDTLGERKRPKGIPKATLIATFLDPRTKNLNTLNMLDKGFIEAAVREKLIATGATVQPAVQPNRQRNQSQRNDLYGDLLDGLDDYGNDEDCSVLPVAADVPIAPQTIEQLVDAELVLWISEAAIPRLLAEDVPNNPLLWWKINQSRFPMLSVLARKYLAIPATSAPSERLFSSAGLTIAKERSRLTPEHAANLIFLHDNLDIINRFRRSRSLDDI